MRIRSLIILLFLSVVPFGGFTQDIAYARSVVDTLAAPGMHGRGYLNDGDKIAAAFIENEFKKFGLKSFGDSYRQEFTLSVNTFPGSVQLSIDGVQLKPGKDFIVSAESKGALLKRGKVIWIDSTTVADREKQEKLMATRMEGKVLVIDERSKAHKEQINVMVTMLMRQSDGKFPEAIVYVKDKLTWSVSQEENPGWVTFEVLDGKITRDAERISFNVESDHVASYKTQNVIGYIPGSQYPDSFIVFSAHYDHLGRMGKDAYFPGANDNASGIAMLLNLAKHYSKPENEPKYSVAFMAFGAEEAGLVGSRYYVENPLFPLKQVKFLINTDLAGTGDEGITVVNGTVYNTYFKQLVKLNAQGSYLKDVKPRGKAANSDHYYFSEKGVPAFFIYTMGGIRAYHDIYDRAETLPLTEFEDYFKLLNDFIKYLTNEH